MGQIAGTPYEEDVRRWIAAGWSSTSIARYVQARFRVDMQAGAVRVYKHRNRDAIAEQFSDLQKSLREKAFADRLAIDEEVDTLGELVRLIRLQKARIDIDAAHEETMGKLFVTTRGEVKVLSDLLAQYHAMQQDWAEAPKAGVTLDVRVHPAMDTARAMSVLDLIEADDDAEVIALGRKVWERQKALEAPPNGDRTVAG